MGERLVKLALPGGTKYMIRLNVRAGARFNQRTWLDREALVPMLEQAVNEIRSRVQGVGDASICGDKVELEITEPCGKYIRDAVVVLTEMVSIATAKVNQLLYAKNAIGYASGKLQPIIISGEILTMGHET